MKTVTGLTKKEVEKARREFGQNNLPEKPPPSNLSIFLSQLKSPLVLVLVVASMVTLFLQEFADSSIIFLAILVNATLGYMQERKAGEALSALKKMVTLTAEVIREGKTMKVSASDIVPGDIAVLRAGYKVPADGELIDTNRLFLNESALTGESISVNKDNGKEVFMGTIVASGYALFRVKKIGADTEIGKIALNVQEIHTKTPLQIQLQQFSRRLLFIVLFLTITVFLLGTLFGRDPITMFKTSVALAVSAIPEGLLIALTIVLAIGMQRILKRNGLVRELSSAETLGGVTTICTDKTGTLTEGNLSVIDVLGDKEKVAHQLIVANDMDDPIVITGYEWARRHLSYGGQAKRELGVGSLELAGLSKKNVRIDSIPFSSETRFFASLNGFDRDKNTLFVSGAPDYLLNWTNLTKSQRKVVQKQIESYTSKGYRLIGFLEKDVLTKKEKIDEDFVKEGFTWNGLVAFSDPVRTDVKKSLLDAMNAGIKIIVITGDYPKTARAIMKELGIFVSDQEYLTGQDLLSLTETDLQKKLTNVKLFARTTPHQKLKIVESLKKNGEVVAMIGDGVNDAPALTKADIGIVVGDATDVARESADLVLLDSKFKTIIAAIEEGRAIFENVRKVILYLMATAFNEITLVIGSILLGLPLPLTAAQILWINIVSDSFPSLALTVEEKRSGLMKELPRTRSEALVNSWMTRLIALVSMVSGLSSLFLFWYVYQTTGNKVLAQSVGFLVLGMNSLIYVFSIRTLREPFWKIPLLKNKWLFMAVFGGIIAQTLPFFVPSMRKFFEIVLPSSEYWLLAGLSMVFVFLLIEIVKPFSKRFL